MVEEGLGRLIAQRKRVIGNGGCVTEMTRWKCVETEDLYSWEENTYSSTGTELSFLAKNVCQLALALIAPL